MARENVSKAASSAGTSDTNLELSGRVFWLEAPMLSSSRYVLNGSPRGCAFCREPLREEAHRRGEQYFCNELCADACIEPRYPAAEDGAPRLSVISG
jgi:hypothetical protein